MNSDLEQRFIELQRHANELEHLLVEEKAKVFIIVKIKRHFLKKKQTLILA